MGTTRLHTAQVLFLSLSLPLYLFLSFSLSLSTNNDKDAYVDLRASICYMET